MYRFSTKYLSQRKEELHVLPLYDVSYVLVNKIDIYTWDTGR